MFFSIRDLKLNMTRARRCGFNPDHAGNARCAACDRAREFLARRERHPRLHFARRGIEHIAEPAARARRHAVRR